MLRKSLLVCGILSSALYVAANIIVPMQWDAYSIAGQTVSELSAVGAPTRAVWVWLVTPYVLLLMAFGCGVWMSAGRSWQLRVAAGALIGQGVIGIYWPPMHLRGVEMSLTDILHIVWAGATLVLMSLAIGFGAAALGRAFRRYSVATIVVFVVFGTLTGIEGPRIAANLPTPSIGVWERVNIAAFLLWVAVLAAALLRAPSPEPSVPHVAAASREGLPRSFPERRPGGRLRT